MIVAGTDQEQIALRIPRKLANRVRKYQEHWKKENKRMDPSFSDAVRWLLEEALDQRRIR